MTRFPAANRSGRLFAVIVAVFVLGATGVNADTIFVKCDATGANNGTSWDDAYLHLQTALAKPPQVGDEIWVAKGTYMPDGGRIPDGGSHVPGTGDRNATFQLISGVAIYGGFSGNEDSGTFNLADRDFETNETILSGDLNGDESPGYSNCCSGHAASGCDDPGCEATVCAADSYCCEVSWDRTCAEEARDLCGTLCGSAAENSYHVVTGSGTDATARLDGVTIAKGNSNGEQNHDSGGGVYISSGSPALYNCTFRENWRRRPGAQSRARIATPLSTTAALSIIWRPRPLGAMEGRYVAVAAAPRSATVRLKRMSPTASAERSTAIPRAARSSPTLHSS